MNNKFSSAENTPNAGRLMESLRNSGYKDEVAIADLIDNSIDAEAKNVKISVSENANKKLTISILDDGIGMDYEGLSQALRLGSLTEHDGSADLGKFGLGLVTASISLTKRVELYTLQKDGVLLTGILDIDAIIKNNSFDIERGEANKEHQEIAKQHGLSQNGTLLVLRDCDKLSKNNLSELVNTLSNHFGEIYRYFMRAGLKMEINDEPVLIKDPMWEDGIYVEENPEIKTALISDEKYPVKTDDGNTENLRIKIYQIPEFDQKMSNRFKVNQATQGFYILRNYRQIAKGLSLGRFTKHNSANRIRIEVIFSADLDKQMGINFSKHSVNPEQAIIDLLDQHTYNTVQTLRKRQEKTDVKKNTDDLKDDFLGAERSIKASSKLLQKAITSKTSGSITKKKLTDYVAQDLDKDKKKSTGSKFMSKDFVKFGTHSFTSSGPIIDVEKEGKTTIIIWNVDHPFYKKFLVDNSDNKDLFNAVNSLAFVLGEAKLQYSTDEERSKMLEDMLITMSSNLRVLLD